jgi:hypothetical protein
MVQLTRRILTLRMLTKGSAAAMTLAAPAADDDGTKSSSKTVRRYAHVTTATGLIHDGVTGGAKNAYTSGRVPRFWCHLVAY